MYKLKHKEYGESTVSSELSYTRHLEAGWELVESEEKKEEVEQVKRGPKPKNREVD